MNKMQRRNERAIHITAVRLKEVRNKKSLTQAEVYKATGINVGRIEAEQSNITVSTLDKLCRYYGVSLKEFYAGMDKASDKI